MLREEFSKENVLVEKTEYQKEDELIRNIIKTKQELKAANRNFEFADYNLVDYYVYQMKANQAKLDYLIKLAKAKGMKIDVVDGMKFELWNEEEDAI